MDTRFAPEVRDDAKILMMHSHNEDELGNNISRGGPDVSMLPNYVPVLSLRQDGTYYFDYHHTADDTLDKIDLEAIVQTKLPGPLSLHFLPILILIQDQHQNLICLVNFQ